MQISSQLATRNSDEEFRRALFQYSDSGVAMIHIRTGEMMRTVYELRRILCLVPDNIVQEWNVLDGSREINSANMRRYSITGDGKIKLNDAMVAPGALYETGGADQTKTYFFVYVSPHPFMERNPGLQHMCEAYAYILPASTIRVIVVTPDAPLPDSYKDVFSTLQYDPPSMPELEEYLDNVLGGCEEGWIENLDEEGRRRIVYTGVGMTRQAFTSAVSLAIVRSASLDRAATVDDIIAGVSMGKTEVVKQNDLLELTHPEEMENVGGMERLKEWVRKRRNCFSDEAREFGIKSPKGMVFVGPPGTGKSLSAKAVASEFGVPLLRFDFGRVFNSLIGSSEERMRTALRMVESMSPCVLFCDEIDKGLSGLGGSGDSGTSTRVFGTFLTWLQENMAPVFTVVTANNIHQMPPEMMRRGRFDAIFASSLPNEIERTEILRIHLRKVNHEDVMPRTNARRRSAAITEFLNASNGYVGSEIESAVQDGLVEAFSNGEEFSLPHVNEELRKMVPLSKSYRLQIAAMVFWAKANATPAGAEEITEMDDLNDEEKSNVRKLVVRNFSGMKGADND